MLHRTATTDDVDAAAHTIALAFADDPIWSPTLARPDGATDHLEPFWRLWVQGAMRYSTVYVADAATPGIAAAVAVWLPPEGTEMSPEQLLELSDLMIAALPPESIAAMEEMGQRFYAHRPVEPHMYLNFLATHPDHRGQGLAQRVLAENLAEFDAQGVPSYLESSNPANIHRYERAGFSVIGGFRAVLGDAYVTTMWRDAR
jgi:ribosomal protein S18 acetylase RimI-like enzyme